MDLFDQASEAEERFRAQALAAQAKRAPPAGDWDALSAKWCKAPRCGERIPDERRRAIPGVRFCVDCQTLRERKTRK